MRIAQVAPPFESVPPRYYGGTERVIHILTEELIKMGHSVTLFASADSVTSARLVPICERGLRLDGIRDPLKAIPYFIGGLKECFSRAKEFDIIHSHVDFLAFPFCTDSSRVIHTMHGRMDIQGYEAVFSRYREQPLISISNSQRLPLPEQNWIATIYHGLPVWSYRFHSEHKGYLVFLGRICPEKRPDWAIRVALKAGIPLKIAAKVDSVDDGYFKGTIMPLLKDPKIEFLGEVTDSQKDELLGNAMGLLIPVDWPEPFGLTFIEALACGTPVISRPCGSLPEIIRHGVTGILDMELDGLVKGIKQISKLDRQRCRQEFEERFSARRMASEYIRVYERLIYGQRVCFPRAG
jgi:glycosyltransferase involved in cell wall biosynthesis